MSTNKVEQKGVDEHQQNKTKEQQQNIINKHQ
jgi:hypothetical protein